MLFGGIEEEVITVCVCVCVCVAVPCSMRILVPQPGIDPVPPALEAQSLNHWTTGEVLEVVTSEWRKRRGDSYLNLEG